MINLKHMSQRGFSLVELMVAMLLGLLLVGGIVQVVVSNIQTFNSTDGIARVQENARFAIGELSKNIRGVGFKGCLSKDADIDTSKVDALYDVTQQDIIPYIITGGATTFNIGGAGGVAVNDVTTDTQAITIKRLVNIGAHVTADSSGKTLNVPTSAGTIKGGDVLYVSDCEKNDLVDVQSDSSGAIALADDLRGTFKVGAGVYKVEVTTYYIGKNTTLGVNSLFRKVNNNVAEELVIGVSDLEFLFGTDATTTPYFFTAEALTDGTADQVAEKVAKVTSVRLRVNTSSIYPVNADGVMYRDFTVSVALRNRQVAGDTST